MSKREQLSFIDIAITGIDERQTALSLEESGLRESRTLLIKEIFEEEKPLEATTWELFVGNNNVIFLNYVEGNKEKMEEFHKMVFHSWHDYFEIQSGIDFHFDDGVYSLHSSDPGQLKSFAVSNNLIIVAKDIGGKIKRLSRQLNVLQEICHQFNLQV